MRLINRHVLLLCPRQPMIDWVNKLAPDTEPLKVPTPFDHDQASVYLVPEFEDVEDFLDWFKEGYAEFFEDELYEWSEDESLFPKDMSFEAFQAWFMFSYQGLVLDAASDIPLEHVEEDDFFDSGHIDDNSTDFYDFEDLDDDDDDEKGGNGGESDDDDDDNPNRKKR